MSGCRARRSRHRTASANARRSTYRPALDGLRAVAVLAVMVEHSGVRRPGSTELLVPGGFLGVDVFFVISGFLITSLLLIEHAAPGAVDLRRFWRVGPGGCCPRLCGTVARHLHGRRGDRTGDRRRGAAGRRPRALALRRQLAVRRSTDQSYFALVRRALAVPHLWSLSLEEQWYLLLPPRSSGCSPWCGGGRGLLLGVLAAAAARLDGLDGDPAHTPGRDPSRVYYGTDTRAQALLVGALLAVVWYGVRRFTRRFARLTPALGLRGTGGARGALPRGVAASDERAVPRRASRGGRGVGWPRRRRGGPPQRRARRTRSSAGARSWRSADVVRPLPVALAGVRHHDARPRSGLDGAELAAARMAVTFVVATVSYFLIEQPIRRHGLRGLGRPACGGSAGGCTGGIAAVLVHRGPVGWSDVDGHLGERSHRRVDPDDRAGARRAGAHDQRPAGHVLPAIPEDRPLRLVVAGDSVAWSSADPWENDHRGAPEGVPTCGSWPTSGARSRRASRSSRGSKWPTGAAPTGRAVWETTAFGFQPDVMLVMWGAWEVYDHRVGDEVLVAGHAEYGLAVRAGHGGEHRPA